jgi:hypothetical protein
MRDRFKYYTCFVVVFFVIIPAHATAQAPLVEGPARPTQGVLLGDQRDVQSAQALSLNVSALGTYDDNIIGGDGAIAASQARQNGYYTSGSATLFYSKRLRRAQFVADGGASLQYYPDLATQIQQPLDAYNATAGLLFEFARSRLRVSQSIRHQPFFGFDLAEPVVNPDVALIGVNNPSLRTDLALFSEPVITHDTAASLYSPISRRTWIDVSYGYGGSTRSEFWPTLNGQSAGIRVTRSAVRSLQFNAGYTYRAATYESRVLLPSDVTSHEVDAGIRYVKPFSPTRTLTVSAGAGTATIQDQLLAPIGFESSNSVTAHGSVTFQFMRSWAADAEYRRSLQLLQGLDRPYYGDSVRFGIQGFPASRIDVSVSGQLMTGDPISSVLSRGYDTTGASARIRYALTRKMGLFAEYLLSSYEFEPDVVLPPGILRRFDRDVMRFGVVFRTALIGR